MSHEEGSQGTHFKTERVVRMNHKALDRLEVLRKLNGSNNMTLDNCSVPGEPYASKDARTVREGRVGVVPDARLSTSRCTRIFESLTLLHKFN
jgi:hypothetical protein